MGADLPMGLGMSQKMWSCVWYSMIVFPILMDQVIFETFKSTGKFPVEISLVVDMVESKQSLPKLEWLLWRQNSSVY